MRHKGVRFWNDRGRYYSQENNPTEAYLKATRHDRDSWLESCGPTAAVNCLAAMGKSVDITCPGTFKPQPEEVLMDFFNDPRIKDDLREIRSNSVVDMLPENRVPQYYPHGVYAVFGVRGRFEWGNEWESIVKELDRGRAVQLCLKNPGHYIAVLAYDTQTRELIYNDPWGARFPDGKGGHNRRLSTRELRENVQPFRITYGV